MKNLLLIILLSVSSSAFAESIVVQPADPKIGSLNIVVNGTAGGAAEELLSYYNNSGAQTGLVWGWKKTLGKTIYSFFMTVQPDEVKALNIQAKISSDEKQSSQAQITVPDGASGIIYDLMLKSGVQANPSDASKALYGKNIVCWGFHGFPGNQTTLNPTCKINVH